MMQAQCHKGALILSELILGQTRKMMNKLYSLDASEVEDDRRKSFRASGRGKRNVPRSLASR